MSLLVAVLVIWGAAAGAETGNDDPPSGDSAAAELLPAVGVFAIGALSVGGAASMVSPPDDFAASEDEDVPVDDEL